MELKVGFWLSVLMSLRCLLCLCAQYMCYFSTVFKCLPFLSILLSPLYNLWGRKSALYSIYDVRILLCLYCFLSTACVPYIFRGMTFLFDLHNICGNLYILVLFVCSLFNDAFSVSQTI
jgi:hypothetical protein